jgi:hypothetical protein
LSDERRKEYKIIVKKNQEKKCTSQKKEILFPGVGMKNLQNSSKFYVEQKFRVFSGKSNF